MTTYGHGKPTADTPHDDYVDLDTGDVWQMRPAPLPAGPALLLTAFAALIVIVAWIA